MQWAAFFFLNLIHSITTAGCMLLSTDWKRLKCLNILSDLCSCPFYSVLSGGFFTFIKCESTPFSISHIYNCNIVSFPMLWRFFFQRKIPTATTIQIVEQNLGLRRDLTHHIHYHHSHHQDTLNWTTKSIQTCWWHRQREKESPSILFLKLSSIYTS